MNVTRPKRWSNMRIIHKLIRLYRANECLWNPQSPGYHNLALKENAWQRISLFFENQLTVDQLKVKIMALRAYYEMEHMTLEHSKERKYLYSPRHLAIFEKLDFLKVVRTNLDLERANEAQAIVGNGQINCIVEDTFLQSNSQNGIHTEPVDLLFPLKLDEDSISETESLAILEERKPIPMLLPRPPSLVEMNVMRLERREKSGSDRLYNKSNCNNSMADAEHRQRQDRQYSNCSSQNDMSGYVPTVPMANDCVPCNQYNNYVSARPSGQARRKVLTGRYKYKKSYDQGFWQPNNNTYQKHIYCNDDTCIIGISPELIRKPSGDDTLGQCKNNPCPCRPACTRCGNQINSKPEYYTSQGDYPGYSGQNENQNNTQLKPHPVESNPRNQYEYEEYHSLEPTSEDHNQSSSTKKICRDNTCPKKHPTEKQRTRKYYETPSTPPPSSSRHSDIRSIDSNYTENRRQSQNSAPRRSESPRISSQQMSARTAPRQTPQRTSKQPVPLSPRETDPQLNYDWPPRKMACTDNLSQITENNESTIECPKLKARLSNEQGSRYKRNCPYYEEAPVVIDLPRSQNYSNEERARDRGASPRGSGRQVICPAYNSYKYEEYPNENQFDYDQSNRCCGKCSRKNVNGRSKRSSQSSRRPRDQDPCYCKYPPPEMSRGSRTQEFYTDDEVSRQGEPDYYDNCVGSDKNKRYRNEELYRYEETRQRELDYDNTRKSVPSTKSNRSSTERKSETGRLKYDKKYQTEECVEDNDQKIRSSKIEDEMYDCVCPSEEGNDGERYPSIYEDYYYNDPRQQCPQDYAGDERNSNKGSQEYTPRKSSSTFYPEECAEQDPEVYHQEYEDDCCAEKEQLPDVDKINTSCTCEVGVETDIDMTLKNRKRSLTCCSCNEDEQQSEKESDVNNSRPTCSKPTSSKGTKSAKKIAKNLKPCPNEFNKFKLAVFPTAKAFPDNLKNRAASPTGGKSRANKRLQKTEEDRIYNLQGLPGHPSKILCQVKPVINPKLERIRSSSSSERELNFKPKTSTQPKNRMAVICSYKVPPLLADKTRNIVNNHISNLSPLVDEQETRKSRSISRETTQTNTVSQNNPFIRSISQDNITRTSSNPFRNLNFEISKRDLIILHPPVRGFRPSKYSFEVNEVKTQPTEVEKKAPPAPKKPKRIYID